MNHIRGAIETMECSGEVTQRPNTFQWKPLNQIMHTYYCWRSPLMSKHHQLVKFHWLSCAIFIAIEIIEGVTLEFPLKWIIDKERESWA